MVVFMLPVSINRAVKGTSLRNDSVMPAFMAAVLETGSSWRVKVYRPLRYALNLTALLCAKQSPSPVVRMISETLGSHV